MLLFNAMVNSYLDYGFIAWGDKINKTKMKSLMTLQKKALRLVFDAKYNAHSHKLFALSGIIPVDEKYKVESLTFLKKMQKGEQPRAFANIIEFGTDARLRSNTENKIKLTRHRKGSMMYSMASEWNKCEPELRNCTSTNHMKSELRHKIKETMLSRKCSKKKCYYCRRDKEVDYKSYMQR